MSKSITILERLEASKNELANIIKNHEKFDFPDFLAKLRMAADKSCKQAAKDLGIDYYKLYHLELGFLRAPSNSIISRISEYFGIPFDLVNKKISNYLQKRGK